MEVIIISIILSAAKRTIRRWVRVSIKRIRVIIRRRGRRRRMENIIAGGVGPNFGLQDQCYKI